MDQFCELSPEQIISGAASFLLLALSRASFGGGGLAAWLRGALGQAHFPTPHASDHHKLAFIHNVLNGAASFLLLALSRASFGGGGLAAWLHGALGQAHFPTPHARDHHKLAFINNVLNGAASFLLLALSRASFGGGGLAAWLRGALGQTHFPTPHARDHHKLAFINNVLK
ncbi:unnamed protein product [Plutella xylostella]|uniref:(diamondback moth) hypothetical protein n=1 Tax=Plutella xylostella TaxID=51655 RepID=A0A8S4EIG4_PLUXY|nr:unnamed protein product [Plutella xylostella]